MPAWHVLAPLGLVVVALVLLVIVPLRITEQNQALRQELAEMLEPLDALQAQLERSIAAEAAAARGLALTGDPFFADRFLEVHAFAEQVARQVDSLARIYGGRVAEAAEAFQQEREAWSAANLGSTRTSLRANIAEHQRRYEAVSAAAVGLDEILEQEAERHRRHIGETERLSGRITEALALLALLAAAAALLLAWRLHESKRLALGRARDEAALRRIAQAMAQAEDLPGALATIARAASEMVGARGALIEEVDGRKEEIEVVARAGEGPALGVRAAYAGSLAERVITRGEAERTNVEAMAVEQRPMATHMAAHGSRHVLSVPLLSEGEALGALLLHRTARRRPFSEQDAARARVLADLAALVLRRLRHFEETARRERALQETSAELRALTETLEERVRERTGRVQELSRALTLAEQRERRELAQALHDDLQQVLYGLQLGLKSLERTAPALDGATLAEELRRSHDLVGEALAATRRLTVDLSPPVLATEGLAEALHWLAAHVEERFGLAVEVRAEGELPPLAEDVRILLFQLARELLFNVVKHARVERATVAVGAAGGALVLEVVDEGAGFDALAEAPESTLGGFGLRRAHERLALFGGCLELASEPGKGTRANVSVPLEQVRHEGRRRSGRRRRSDEARRPS